MKKLNLQSCLKLGIATLCFVLAGLVYALTRSPSGGIQDIPTDDLTWTLCLACGYSEQMPVRDFFAQQQQEMLATHNMMASPKITCPHCGKTAMVCAMKCKRCGTVFVPGSAPGDYYDRCPHCGFSPLESQRANAANEP